MQTGARTSCHVRQNVMTESVDSLRISSLFVFEHVADIWRVVLKGEIKDYIHASFAHVRADLHDCCY